MENLQKMIAMLLKDVSPQQVIENNIVYNYFTKEEFVRLAHSYMRYYSEDEAVNMWGYYKTNFEDRAARIFGLNTKEERDEINVFSALFAYCDEMLILKENQVLCRYKYLLSWRKLTTVINEDILIAAYMARQSNHLKMEDMGYSWDIITKHNNFRLYEILNKGISENHFHFWGSIPIFQMSWISLMNNVTDSKVLDYFRKYDKEKRDTKIAYTDQYIEKSLSLQYLQAAMIRILLFSFLTGAKIRIGSYKVPYIQYHNLTKNRLENFAIDYEVIKEGINKNYIEEDNNLLSKDNISCSYWFKQFIFILLGQQKSEIEKAQTYRKFMRNNPKLYWILENLVINTNVTEKILNDIRDVIKNSSKKDTIEKRNVYIIQRIKNIMLMNSEVDLADLYDFIEKSLFNQIWQDQTLKNVKKILKSETLLIKYRENLQGVIDGLNANYRRNDIEHKKYKLEDYMLYAFSRRGENGSFSGENWFLYKMFQQVNSFQREKDDRLNLFYAYLLLRESIRSEIVQVNDNVGFANFQKYQSRKGNLIEDELFHDYDVQKALSYNILKPNMESLEVRITPPAKAEDMGIQIKNIDQLINPDHLKELEERYFYVYHFVKDIDVFDKTDDNTRCRHYEKRREVELRAKEIVRFRRINPHMAKKVLGIDACSSEIGCRPEIFATAFRYLSNHIRLNNVNRRDDRNLYDLEKKKKIKYANNDEKMPQLRITYHAGEEFLDVADGLRAIDEAILYFNLDCGDRLGHAIALGINVDDWYKSKGNCILISKQDYLDNIVWLFGKIVDLKIEGQEELKDYLQKEYSLYFKMVYENHIDSETIAKILKKMKNKYQGRYRDAYQVEHKLSVLPYGADNVDFKFDIYSYYRAWKLRGDDPLYYKNGFFEPDYLSVENNYDYYKVNREFPAHFELRYMPEVTILYYYYHYSIPVKKQGDVRVEKAINPLYIKGVKAVQKKMQQIIGQKGIAIETNPSSNCRIGTFRDYEKHPIMEFYNRELEHDYKKLEECSQLCVSINTDDKGVFSTSLENEYSLMARALEEMKKEDGSPKYSREEVNSWLDAIRRMGNMQSFHSEYQRKKNDLK